MLFIFDAITVHNGFCTLRADSERYIDNDRMMKFKPDPRSAHTLYDQLAAYVSDCMADGTLASGDRLLSVSEACRAYGVSRDTVLAAYRTLQRHGEVVSVAGKGFFVARRGAKDTVRVFMLFDAMNQYKETLYRSLVDALGPHYGVSIAFHYYNAELFDSLVAAARGKYDYYVLMPHFNCDVTSVLDRVPADRLLLLDAFPEGYSRNCAAVYQRFYTDAYEGLKALLEKLRRYEALHILYNGRFQYMPDDYIAGAYRFAGEFRYPVYVERDFDMDAIAAGHCYMAVAERDLAAMIKSIMAKGLVVGRDIGLLSLDDTPLKEVLIGGITTLTTDFAIMGRTAAELIRSGEQQRIANPWRLYLRGSL